MGYCKINSLTFIGDLFLPYRVLTHGAVPDSMVVNLEAPVTESERGWPGKVNLKTATAPVRDFLADRVAAVNLANNHICDYGVEGVEDTLRALNHMEIPYFGVATEANCINAPLTVEVGGRKVALLGYACASTGAVFYSRSATTGVVPIEVDRIVEDIRNVRAAGADAVVVSLHWGDEEVDLPTPDDVEKARAIIDGGADLIVGHHAHRLQPYEVYRGKYIFYGLGNAFFPDLDVPCCYDEDRRNPGRYRKKQHFWNRRSLAVTWHPEDMTVSVRGVRCDQGTILFGAPAAPTTPWQTEGIRDYPAYYRRRKQRCLLQLLVFNWFSSPKLPRLRHLSAVKNIFRKSARR